MTTTQPSAIVLAYSCEHRFSRVTLPNGDVHTFNAYNSAPDDAEEFVAIRACVLGAPIVRTFL